MEGQMRNNKAMTVAIAGWSLTGAWQLCVTKNRQCGEVTAACGMKALDGVSIISWTEGK